MSQNKVQHLTERQHFVPQVYLRGFTRADVSDRDQVHVYDLITKRTFPSNIANVAFRKYFHDFPHQFIQPGDDPQVIEHFLAENVEGRFGAALRNIVDSVEQYGIVPEQRILLAFFAMFQNVRTAQFRDHFEVLFGSGSLVIQEYAKQQQYPAEIPDLTAIDQFTPELASLWHAALLGDPPAVLEMAKSLIGHVMYIGVNDSELPLWTSDNPVVSTCHDTTASVWGGLSAPGTEILYPLTKRLILVMWERSFVGQEYPNRAALDGQCIPLDVENVKYCNAQQVAQCTRQIYSPTVDFSLIQEIEMKNPGTLDRHAVTIDDLLSG